MSRGENLRALGTLVQAVAADRPAAPVPRALVPLIRAQGLAPLAYTHGLTEFRADYALSSIRADQQRAIAGEAVDALVRVGIPVVLLKGISYAGWLYADPAERPMSDVDLLVRDGDHARAVTAVACLGYRHAGPSSQWSSRHHAITLKRPQASVDLHRGPAQRDRIAIPMNEVWARATPAAWVPGAHRLAELDDVLFHFANLARHDLIVPLVSFVDAARMLRRLDGDQRCDLMRTASCWRFARVLRACIEAVEVTCGWRARGRWWLPPRDQVLSGELPRRPVQLGRKLLLIEGPRELVAYGHAVVDGWLASVGDH